MSIPVMLSMADSRTFPNRTVEDMTLLWKYWQICRLSPQNSRVGYEYRVVPPAQDFLQQQIAAISNSAATKNREIQTFLISYFQGKNSADIINRAIAGLCLRCNVSYPILKACQKIDSLFSPNKGFTYKDLLPFVLNDDGMTPVILDRDRKTQLILDQTGKAQATAYKFFTVEVLRTFKPEEANMSLENWAYLQTKQNQEIKDFLSEFGFKNLSDWALLNRSRPKQLERLSSRSCYLVEVFHAVYRRDRRQQRQGSKKCPEPSNNQLEEMRALLQERGIIINANAELMRELKQVATELRQYDIWSSREPLEIQDPDGNDVTRPDLPYDSIDEIDVEQQEFLEFLHQQLREALTGAVEKEICDRIAHLQKSKKYASLSQQFIPGLKLYYCQNMSLKEIAPMLGMTSWDQARRILNPGEILNTVRSSTIQQVLDKTLEKAQSMGLTKIPPTPDYLKTLVEQVEAFADKEIFQEAMEEIRAGKNRAMNSLYAQQLRIYFEQHKEHLK